MWEGNYILAEDGKTPVWEPDVMKWGRWYEKADRHVACDTIGSVKISTVFLGMDHNYHLAGPPVLWETMIFGATGDLEHYQERYTSYEDAVEGHQHALMLVMENQTKQ